MRAAQAASASGSGAPDPKRAAKRLVSAADPRLDAPEPLAYRIGIAEAIDRLLLQGKAGSDTKALESWQRPRLPVGGGDLVARGLEAGPLVAKTLQAIEAEWVAHGFPREIRDVIDREVAQALRSSQ